MTNAAPLKPAAPSVVVEALTRVLADSYRLTVKTQNFHWNVVGPHFAPLHAQFQSQYEELADAVDEVAERLRALGQRAPGSMKEFLALGSLPEAQNEELADDMVRSLEKGHRALTQGAKAALDAAQRAGDDVTVDLMVERIAAHDKAAWMLGSFLVH